MTVGRGWGAEATYASVPSVPDLVGGSVEGTNSRVFGQSSALCDGKCRFNPQLKGESTGEDSRQEDGVLANEGPKQSEEHTVRLLNINYDYPVDRGETCW